MRLPRPGRGRGKGETVMSRVNSTAHAVLVINPGAVSTKVALYRGENEEWAQSAYHPDGEMAGFGSVASQEEYRYRAVVDIMRGRGVSPQDLDAVVGRGGLMKPVASGTYVVGPALLSDLRDGIQGEHASNLGGILAQRVAGPLSIPAFVVDPVAVDEMSDLARASGLKDIQRRSLAHTLNIKAVCRQVMDHEGPPYVEARVVAVHLGSGISVTAHDRGHMVDVNNAVEEGPFGTERTGGLPVLQLVDWVLEQASGGCSAREIQRMLTRTGGLYSYTGTRDLRAIEARAGGGDAAAASAIEALAYQVSKEIGAMYAVLSGQVDRVIITGAMAHSQRLVELIASRVSGFAPLSVVPGEREMEALALGALRVLVGAEEAREYG